MHKTSPVIVITINRTPTPTSAPNTTEASSSSSSSISAGAVYTKRVVHFILWVQYTYTMREAFNVDMTLRCANHVRHQNWQLHKYIAKSRTRSAIKNGVCTNAVSSRGVIWIQCFNPAFAKGVLQVFQHVLYQHSTRHQNLHNRTRREVAVDHQIRDPQEYLIFRLSEIDFYAIWEIKK